MIVGRKLSSTPNCLKRDGNGRGDAAATDLRDRHRILAAGQKTRSLAAQRDKVRLGEDLHQAILTECTQHELEMIVLENAEEPWCSCSSPSRAPP